MYDLTSPRDLNLNSKDKRVTNRPTVEWSLEYNALLLYFLGNRIEY